MNWVSFGGIIGKVVFARCPLDGEVPLLDPVLYPKVFHGDSFAAFDLGGAVGEFSSCTVVVSNDS